MVQRVGLIGCGNIAPTYLRNARYFPGIRFVACADERRERAVALAGDSACEASTVSELLASQQIDIVLNLTPATAHYAVTHAALLAGKHVYSEKPLANSVSEARTLLGLAESSGRRLGVAPDTFLGPLVQRARALINEGALGEVVHGIAAFMTPGMEAWHPRPAPFFRRGGGPMLDIGPYAVTALVTILGPVKSVIAMGRIGRRERTVLCGPDAGQTFAVEVPTTIHAILLFASGAQVTVLGSFDTVSHNLPALQLFGVGGSLRMSSPHVFGGEIFLKATDGQELTIDTALEAYGVPNTSSPVGMVADYRGMGLADMAEALESNRPHQANAILGMHVLEVFAGIDTSIQTGKAVSIAEPTDGEVFPTALTDR